MMHMTIYWGKDVTLLFDWWTTDSWIGYALTLLVCFLFSIFHQYMEDIRLRFRSTSSSVAAADRPSQPSAIGTPLLSKLGRNHSPQRLAAAALFGFNSAIGYFLMLAIMSFNGGVLLAVVLGLFVGFYLFRSGDDKDDDPAAIVDNSCACT